MQLHKFQTLTAKLNDIWTEILRANKICLFRKICPVVFQWRSWSFSTEQFSISTAVNAFCKTNGAVTTTRRL